MSSHKEKEESIKEDKSAELLKRVSELSSKLEGQKKQSDEFKEIAQRVQAEFENFSKRSQKERGEFQVFANAKLVEKFLPVLDSFDDGITALQKQQNFSKDDYLNGLKLLKKQFFAVLEKEGLKEIDAVGKKFDPHFHEVLLKDHDKEKQDEVVLEQLQKGYTINGKVLRTSKVKINQIEDENSTGNEV